MKRFVRILAIVGLVGALASPASVPVRAAALQEIKAAMSAAPAVPVPVRAIPRA